uniref:Uncharacterized protein n=1 Tax=Glossina pallidipes TaxID=7398 RepID=A0A1A9ZGI8_GLOPL
MPNQAELRQAKPSHVITASQAASQAASQPASIIEGNRPYVLSGFILLCHDDDVETVWQLEGKFPSDLRLFLKLTTGISNLSSVLFSVDGDEIQRLGESFSKCDFDNSDGSSADEFILPELQRNPLVQGAIDMFKISFKAEGV